MGTQSREDKMLRPVMVVKSNTLYQNHQFEWFIPQNDANLEDLILSNFEYKERGIMEEDASYQQPIPYVIIINPKTQKIIAYQRWSSTSTSGEQRLYGKRSLWVGGHVEIEQKDSNNPLQATALQEIKEEIGLENISKITSMGYINDNSNPVGKVHIWVIYLAETPEEEINIWDGEIAKVGFFSKDEIEEIMNSSDCDVESRSRIAWDAYKNYSPNND